MNRLRTFCTENRERIFVCIVFSFFLFTMLFQLTHSAPWGDEWVEYDYSQASILDLQIFRKIVSTFQPPLYNILMHFWLMIGKSVLWFRLFNLIPGALSGIFLFKSLKRLYSVPVACCGLLGLAACHKWVYCIQECSEYALMLMFLSMAIYFYIDVDRRWSIRGVLAFVLSCVGAIYSQYGSIFIVLPLLGLFYFQVVFDKAAPARRKARISALYVLCFLVFALPLFYFFLRRQMAHNKIGANAVEFQLGLFKDIPFALGRIVAYFYALPTGGAWECLPMLFGVLMLLASVVLFARGRLSRIKRSLLIAFWFCYVLHYLLVVLHIYAMVHPDRSAGFLERYSFFYIPLMTVVFPVMICEMYRLCRAHLLKAAVLGVVALCALCAAFSFNRTLDNWYKAYDDQFAKIWMDESGWEDETYLFGTAKYGFRYYVSRADGFQEEHFSRANLTADLDNLPARFWAWQSSWGTGSWQALIDRARAEGYAIKVYADYGAPGRLFYCYRE